MSKLTAAIEVLQKDKDVWVRIYPDTKRHDIAIRILKTAWGVAKIISEIK